MSSLPPASFSYGIIENVRVKVQIGDTNEFGVSITGGPYSVRNTTSWDFLCPYCNRSFVAPTTKFKSAKSCYSCRGNVRRTHLAESTWDYLYHVVKGRKAAKEKGFGLSKEEFQRVSQMNCKYCGAEPTNTSGRQEWHPDIKINGLDRVDPSRGYYDDNIVACCKFCNVAKLDNTEEEFYSWVKRVAAHLSL